jgi:hypothetical protein
MSGEFQPPRPIVRAKAPDEPAPKRASHEESLVLEMPSPEQLGVGRTRRSEESNLDWKQVDRHLEQIGAICSQRRKLSGGGYCFDVILPTGQRDQVRHVQTEAPTEAEAVKKTLEKIEEFSGR